MGTIIYAKHTAELLIPALPHAARPCHTLPNLIHLVVYIGQLCNAGCIAIFNKDVVVIAPSTAR
jgi:hypothetical protein